MYHLNVIFWLLAFLEYVEMWLILSEAPWGHINSTKKESKMSSVYICTQQSLQRTWPDWINMFPKEKSILDSWRKQTEETLAINQQLLVVIQYHRFDKVPELTNGMRTLRLWSQSHSKSLCRFTSKLSGLGAAVLNNKCNAFSYTLISKALGCSHTCWKQKQARMDSRCRDDLTVSELWHVEVKVSNSDIHSMSQNFIP